MRKIYYTDGTRRQLNLFREIIVDNFAGGGGSTGIELATGLSVDIAINHDPAAIAMHQVNHPDTEHYCESVWEVDPREAAKGRPIGLAWFSRTASIFQRPRAENPLRRVYGACMGSGQVGSNGKPAGNHS
ncbi:hypothetical protein [Bacillus velezensis]|uniref:hypothetical protein n=1 Tax=Bacillus velezensis TaxID=492670 RepID=UPI001E37658E|nr:hypothetical protein [Bacillus velezensis]